RPEPTLLRSDGRTAEAAGVARRGDSLGCGPHRGRGDREDGTHHTASGGRTEAHVHATGVRARRRPWPPEFLRRFPRPPRSSTTEVRDHAARRRSYRGRRWAAGRPLRLGPRDRRTAPFPVVPTAPPVR